MPFLTHFSRQSARESAEIMRPHGIRWSVMVIKWYFCDPVYKPSLILFDDSMQKGGIAGFYDISIYTSMFDVIIMGYCG